MMFFTVVVKAISTLVQWLTWGGIGFILFIVCAIAWFGYFCFKIALEPPEDIW